MNKARTIGTRKKNKKRPQSICGFTLIELLIVIGIIAVLTAILLPVFSHVRERGRRTACQSNLRQIAAAMQQYVQDYDGVYPTEMFAYHTGGVTTEVYWPEVLFPYSKSREVFHCSSSPPLPAPPPPPAEPRLSSVYDKYDYNFNQRLNTFHWSEGTPSTRILTVDGKHEAELPKPSTTWLNGDRVWVNDETHQCMYCEGVIGRVPLPPCGGRFYGSTVHGGGGNYSFLDGHVKWYTVNAMAEVECQNDPTPGGLLNH